MITGKATVLIADDDEINLDLLSRYLCCNGYDTYTTEKGTRIIEMIINEKQSIDIILLGNMLPDLNGHDVLKILRQEYSLSELPIIMLTDRRENEAAINALQLGANDYVNKPINHKIIKARVDTQVKLKRIQSAYREIQENLEQIMEQRVDEIKNVNSILTSDRKILQYLLSSNHEEKADNCNNEFLESTFMSNHVKKIAESSPQELFTDPEFRINRELLAQLFTFIQRVSNSTEQSKIHDKSVIKFADWTLDLNAQELKNLDGVDVGLTSYEFQLLATLVKSPNRVLSRDQIMEYINGRDRIPTDRSIDVLIGKLRKKIEVDPHKPDIIKTIRGTGYKFTAHVHYN